MCVFFTCLSKLRKSTVFLTSLLEFNITKNTFPAKVQVKNAQIINRTRNYGNEKTSIYIIIIPAGEASAQQEINLTVKTHAQPFPCPMEKVGLVHKFCLQHLLKRTARMKLDKSIEERQEHKPYNGKTNVNSI